MTKQKVVRHRTVPRFLRDSGAAFRWAKRNLDVEPVEHGYGGGWAWLEELAGEYSWFAEQTYHHGEIPIYRMVRVRSLDDIRLDCLGKAWSKEKRGAGVYGMTKVPEDEGRDVLIEGLARPSDVDWEYGFASFVYYGTDQWEVSMLPDSPVVVVAVNGQSLDPPVVGSTGDAKETWAPESCR